MTEEEKLDAGLYYDFWDAGVNGRKLNAIRFCRELRQMQDADATEAEQAELIKKYFGSVGRDVCLCPGFMCDSGRNIHVGDQFLANYNVTILDIMPVHIISKFSPTSRRACTFQRTRRTIKSIYFLPSDFSTAVFSRTQSGCKFHSLSFSRYFMILPTVFASSSGGIGLL